MALSEPNRQGAAVKFSPISPLARFYTGVRRPSSGRIVELGTGVERFLRSTVIRMVASNAVEHFLHDVPLAAAATFLALFPIVDPFGGIPVFYTLTGRLTRWERSWVAIKTSLYVFGILVVFLFFGRFVLSFFGISLPVLKIAGGLIVANTAWGMVTSSSRITPAESDEAATKEDVSFTPLAMPLLSGPGAIGVVMGLAAHADHWVAYIGMIVGIAAVALSCYLFLMLGAPLERRLGPGAMGAINRIFGFLILAIAVQLVWDGVADFKG